jgi:hypothetical protein
MLSALVLSAASGLATGQGYENEPAAARLDNERPESSLREPSFIQPSLFAEPAPAPAGEKAEPEPATEPSDLGAMAGGAAGTGAALPTLQGDTTWGGRPAYPHVIAPAVVATVFGIPPVLNDGSDRLVFQSTLPGFLVDSNSLPKSLKSADLVFGLLGFPLTPNVYLPFSAVLLSSPIVGYDMINWAENGSIIPQDRIFFDYRHFDSVGSIEIIDLYGPDPAHGHPNAYYHQQEFQSLSVDRYVIGFEKTFWEGMWSVEVRVPFQGQAAAVQTAFPNESLSDDTAIGNVGIALKRYLLKSEQLNITSGLGVQFPTAPATDFTYKTQLVGTFGGLTADLYESVRIQQPNQTVWLNPFLGASYDSQRRLFAQGMLQLCLPLNPSTATLTTDIPAGTLSDPSGVLFDFGANPVHQVQPIAMGFEPFFRANVDVGFWLYQNPAGRINSLAALLEVNDTNTLGSIYSANVVDLGPQLALGMGKTEIDTGLLVPVTADQAYKWECVLRVNRKF